MRMNRWSDTECDTAPIYLVRAQTKVMKGTILMDKGAPGGSDIAARYITTSADLVKLVQGTN